MNSTELVLRTLEWAWANPWSILVVFAIILALALWASKLVAPDHFYFRGLPRCKMCLDGTGSKHKVVYSNKSTAENAAHRYQRRFGRQRPYRAPCGYWHLTSQTQASSRRITAKR